MTLNLEQLHGDLHGRLQQKGLIPANVMTIASEDVSIPVFSFNGEMRKGRTDIIFHCYQLLPQQRRRLAQDRLSELGVSVAALQTVMTDAPEIDIQESHSVAGFLLGSIVPHIFIAPDSFIRLGYVDIRQDLKNGTMFATGEGGKHKITDWIIGTVYDTIHSPKTVFTIAKAE